MDIIFNITNLKSTVTFLHLVGLAFGVGGAWILDAFIIKHLKLTISISAEKFHLIKFVSKFVLIGLALLWLSGLLFIAYYYFYTPEYLSNQKVWGKVFIVSVLTVNGILVHISVLPKLKTSIGKSLFASLPRKDIQIMTAIGTISFMSWLFPIVLGVAKTLNFTVSAGSIIAFYLITLVVSVIISSILCRQIHSSMNLKNSTT